VKFTHDHGTITLKVNAEAEQNEMQFAITDSGIGISEEDQQKLFKPFVQLDGSLSRPYEGSGLGLMIVQKLVDMHGGTVHVQSELGRGSCFTVTLPWQKDTRDPNRDEPALPVPNVFSTAALPAGNGVRILLAEDNDSNVMVIREYLESHGYEIFTASHGGEALIKAAEVSPALILMDIQMPQMDGLEAIRRLRVMPAFATVPIIALTAFAMSGDHERCLEAGATEYMTKPVHLGKLHEMISTLLKE
jgi:CheY-like chemotaxis protein